MSNRTARQRDRFLTFVACMLLGVVCTCMLCCRTNRKRPLVTDDTSDPDFASASLCNPQTVAEDVGNDPILWGVVPRTPTVNATIPTSLATVTPSITTTVATPTATAPTATTAVTTTKTTNVTPVDASSSSSLVPTPTTNKSTLNVVNNFSALKRQRTKVAATDKSSTYSVLCVGRGPLGLSDRRDECKNPAPLSALENVAVVSIASGARHNAALNGAGRVWTWGTDLCDGCALGRVGDKLVPRTVDGELESAKITSVCCGDSYTVALDTHGRVWSWGVYHGEKSADKFVAERLRESALTETHRQPVIIGGPLLKTRAIAIASGKSRVIALSDRGKVFEWGDTITTGSSVKKMLGPRCVTIDHKGAVARSVWATSCCQFVQLLDGRLFAWGDNEYGQCGVGRPSESFWRVSVPTHVTALDGKVPNMIVGGTHHTVALMADGDVYTWGRSDLTAHTKEPPSVFSIPSKVDELTLARLAVADSVISIAAGEDHSFAVTANGRLYVWGQNHTYQLGLGHTYDVRIPAQIASPQFTVFHRHVIAASAGQTHSLFLARNVNDAPVPLTRAQQLRGVLEDAMVSHLSGISELVDLIQSYTNSVLCRGATRLEDIQFPRQLPLLSLSKTPMRFCNGHRRFLKHSFLPELIQIGGKVCDFRVDDGGQSHVTIKVDDPGLLFLLRRLHAYMQLHIKEAVAVQYPKVDTNYIQLYPLAVSASTALVLDVTLCGREQAYDLAAGSRSMIDGCESNSDRDDSTGDVSTLVSGTMRTSDLYADTVVPFTTVPRNVDVQLVLSFAYSSCEIPDGAVQCQGDDRSRHDCTCHLIVEALAPAVVCPMCLHRVDRHPTQSPSLDSITHDIIRARCTKKIVSCSF